jgi:hypothetical protein
MTRKDCLYTTAIADEICARHAGGETLNEICRDEHMPSSPTVRGWVIEDIDGFAVRYARARDLLLEHWADESISIADDGSNDWMERQRKDGSTEIVLNGEHIHRSRLRIDQRKWLLSKLKPERYGDSLKLTGDLNLNTKTDEQLAARLAQLLSQTGGDRDPGGDGAASEAA